MLISLRGHVLPLRPHGGLGDQEVAAAHRTVGRLAQPAVDAAAAFLRFAAKQASFQNATHASVKACAGKQAS